MKTMRRIGVFVMSCCLVGCAAVAERQPHRFLVLEPRPAATAPATAHGAITPLPTTAASFYDTQDIVFSREPGTRGYYQYSHWTERPARVLEAELTARYMPRAGGLRLATHVVEMVHEASAAPGVARVVVRAELLERGSRAALARRTFMREAPAASHDAAGAVAGFDAAMGRLVDDLVAWADEESARLAR